MVIENTQKGGLPAFLLSMQLLHHRQTTFMTTQAFQGTKVTPWDLQLEGNMVSALIGRAINAEFPLQSLRVEFCTDGLAVSA